MKMIEFNTPYATKYTKSNHAKNQNTFSSEYGVRKTDMVISIDTRTEGKRFKSRLVQK